MSEHVEVDVEIEDDAASQDTAAEAGQADEPDTAGSEDKPDAAEA